MDERGFHLAIAPAFFGFFAYFGTMQAWDEALSKDDFYILKTQIKSLAGSSAGAMTAVLLGIGIEPSQAAKFCETVTLDQFADFPGLLGAFKGDLFEELMVTFAHSQKPNNSLQLEDCEIPTVVTGFDLKTFKTKYLTNGSALKAARASATFPLLFQPAIWNEKYAISFLIDGGIEDNLGLMGLSMVDVGNYKRIVNIVVGSFGSDGPLGPSSMPTGVLASEVVSISIKNTPQSGPLAMENGPRANESARKAMLASLDIPMYRGKEKNHYILEIDASLFLQ